MRRMPVQSRPLRRRLALALKSLLLLACLHSPAAPAASDADLQPLAPGSPLAGRLGAVGMVIVGEPERPRALGTGFLITPCHVLSAAHVLARGDAPATRNMAVRFLPSSGERAFALNRNQVHGRVTAFDPGYRAGAAGSLSDPANVARDWVLIELESPVAGVEPFRMLYPGARLAPDAPLHAVGYATSPAMTYLYAHENCRQRSATHGAQFAGRMLIADCAVRAGMSGGPLLSAGTDGQLISAGIVVERFQAGERVLAVAVPVEAFARQVAPVLRASNVCAAGQPFAAPPDPTQ